MITSQDLNGQGRRVRGAIEQMRRKLGSPPDLEMEYLWATVSNLLHMLEKEHGAPPGFFGSMGPKLREINPGTGEEMPPPAGYAAPRMVGGRPQR